MSSSDTHIVKDWEVNKFKSKQGSQNRVSDLSEYITNNIIYIEFIVHDAFLDKT
jgi:hypothetical protein